MADFNLYASKLKELDKGFVEGYPGIKGASMMGVSLETYRKFYGRTKGIEDLKDISAAEWTHIIKTEYWDACHGDDIRNQSIAEIFIDWVVQSGTAGIRAFQRTQGMRADGIVGPNTLRILNSPNEEVIFNRLKSSRESYYRKLTMNYPSSYKLLRGWSNRLNKFIFSHS